MSIPILTFYCSRKNVGKTSLVFHLAWMFASLNKRVLVVDMDPQASLTEFFLDDERLEQIWYQNKYGSGIYNVVKPLITDEKTNKPILEKITTDLYLLPGDVALSTFERVLSNKWSDIEANNNYKSLQIISSFWNIMQKTAQEIKAEIILVDTGSNMGAINRSVSIASDYMIIPIGSDIYSFQGLKTMGIELQNWRNLWKKKMDMWKNSKEFSQNPNFVLPQGKIKTIGYLCQQYTLILTRPIKVYDKWLKKIPTIYCNYFLNKQVEKDTLLPQNDENCIAILKHFRNIISIAHEHKKPIFNLTSADGAVGCHASAVAVARKDFQDLAKLIAEKMGLKI